MKIFKDFISLLFPRCCISCRFPLYENETYLCLHCHRDISLTNSHINEKNTLQKNVLINNNLIENLWSYSYFQKKNVIQEVIHHLKYGGLPQLGIEFGEKYGNELRNTKIDFAKFDTIVPVPIHPKKQKKRGYNQSEKIAIGLSNALNISVTNSLSKVIETKTQTTKDREERWLNVKGTFDVKDANFKNKNVLLVDDVITTGATIEACAKVLQKQHCNVSVITLSIGGFL